ncbi:MAG: AAA family ATPase [Gammaproteobacteria bacterium]|nr:AAA family ATPase [Gammaproteobacteria bacterium]
MTDSTRATPAPSQPAALPAQALYRRCDPALLGFASTAELESEVPELLGQQRALEAIQLAAHIERQGFNLFVIGAPGSGKRAAVRRHLEARAGEMPAPADWVYVNNFSEAQKPIALQLPPGTARGLRDALDELIEDLRTVLPAAFETEDYQARRGVIEEEFRQKQEQAFEALGEEAQSQRVLILRTPGGFAMAPATEDGKVMKPEVFNALPDDERETLEQRIEVLQAKLADILKSIPRWDKARRSAVKALNRETAQAAVGHGIDELAERFSSLPQVIEHLEVMRGDLVDNARLFMARPAEDDEGALPAEDQHDGVFERYKINVIVGRDEADAAGAPVIEESHASLANLVGRVEHIAQQGALLTNFQLIKGGALHRANGGFLLLDLRQLLIEPLAWTALKRALRNRCIRIESAGDYLSLISTISLEPEPIPLDLKVVLFGEPLLYYLLAEFDPEVPELFKVVADFDDSTPWREEDTPDYARLIAGICRRESLAPLGAAAVARVIEHCARLVDDRERLSLRLEPVADLLREADFRARSGGSESIDVADIEATLAAQRQRAGRLRERTQEHLLRGITLIDTQGHATGQVNGLSVIQFGGMAFGRPTRITARVRMGAGKVIDIEREARLGGPLHSKGVLILAGYLAAHYAVDVPLSLAATLVFEQSYGGVEGDSASAAELFALLSALAEVPLRQDLAITGSINQMGQVQAIGGVNEKIEGFFDVCAARGLTGSQGVIIPQANVQHLMLQREVVEACDRGEFAVYAVSHGDEALAVLTGLAAGERQAEGQFPVDSLNARVEQRLIGFARARRDFAGHDRERGEAPES